MIVINLFGLGYKLKPIINSEQLLELKFKTQQVIVSEVILNYVQALLAASREQGGFYHGLSPRAGIGIVRAAQAYAATDMRGFIRPDDIQAILPSVINHRLVIRKSSTEFSPAELLLNAVEVPV